MENSTVKIGRNTMKSMLRFLLPAMVLMVLATACKEDQAPQMQPPPPQVTISKPEIRDVVAKAVYTGATEAIQSVDVRARVEGFLLEINFEPGSYVEKDQVLFVIDPRVYEARLAEAEAQLNIRKAELELAQATLDRNEAALKDNAVSEVAVIQARATRNTAVAAVKAAEARIDSLELDLSYTKVTAPASGRISRHLIDVGNLVGRGENTVLARLVNDSVIYAYFTISENDLLRYRKQMAEGTLDQDPVVSLTLGEADQTFEGRIDYIDNRVDTQTGTIGVRAVFDNKERKLVPGLFARLSVPVRRYENAMMVPEQAFGQDQQGYFLMVVNDQNMVEYRPVTTGSPMNGFRPVESGISPEDNIIINGLLKAQPGAPVSPMTPEQAAAGPSGAPAGR